MHKRDIGQEILDGVRETKAFKTGKGNLRTHQVKPPAPPQTVRKKP